MLYSEVTLKPAFNLRLALKRLASVADRFAPWIVILLVAEILTLGTLKAFYKPLWLDEIMGVLIAKLPHGSDIWAICKSGADNQPVLYHYVTRASIRMFGNDALGLRFPSVLGYALFCLCLYCFVSRRTSRLYGVVAMLFPGLTECWLYATEGRPYALMLACAGIAAVCWQSIVMQRRRALMLMGFGLTLACALNLHYYAVLLFIPFGIAEAARTYQRGKVDFPIWLALSVPLLVLFIYVPVLRASSIHSGIPNAFFAKPSLAGSLWKFAAYFFVPSLVALVCLGVLYFAVQIFGRSPAAQFARDTLVKRTELIPEAVLVLSFVCIPVFTLLLSRFATHIFFPRYAIAGIFGVGLLLGFSTWLAFGGARGPALAVVFIFTVVLLHNQVLDDLRFIASKRNIPVRASILRRLPKQAQDDQLPIIATSLDDFMQFFYYGDPAFRKRLFYVSSEALAERYIGYTFHERMMIGSAPFFGTQVVDYAAFLQKHRRFYVFGSVEASAWFSEWVVPKLMADGVELRLVQGGPTDIFGSFADTCLLAQETSE